MSCDDPGTAELAEATAVGDCSTNPKCAKSRTRPRKKNKGRVHWDEQVIAEHDKERGTRQKIDEPDTPFVHSPQTASDSEGCPSSEDEHRRAPGGNMNGIPTDGKPGGSKGPAGQLPLGETLATRLNMWVQSGGNQRRSSHGSSSVASGDGQAVESGASSERESSHRGSVSFPEEETGGESSEEFRAQRRGHYHSEWKEDPSVPAAVSSLETNTNTNLNAGLSSFNQRKARAKNPMEASRPPVQFGEDSVEAEPPSDAFRAQRHEHYNEIAAVRQFRSESSIEDEEEEETDEAAHGGATSSSCCPAVVGGATANPMEPRLSGVAFQVTEGTGTLADVGAARGIADGEHATNDAGWRNNRNAHYSGMAAALRNMPPPSDDEDDSEDEEEGG